MTLPAGVDGELATSTRDDGSKQVTSNGLPLYYFKGDTKPGDTNGEGIGGVWHVAAARQSSTARCRLPLCPIDHLMPRHARPRTVPTMEGEQ